MPAKNQFPPGPGRFNPLLLLRVMTDPYAVAAHCQKRYGDPFTLPSIEGPLVLSGDPQAARALFSADPDQYDIFLRTLLEPIGEGSLLLLTGTPHRAARKLLTPPFHGARMRAYGQLIQELAEQWIGQWQPGVPFLMHRTTQAISLDVILRAIFGVQGEARLQIYRAAVLRGIEALSPTFLFVPALRRDFFGFGPWARYQRAMAPVDQLVAEILAERRAAGTGEDILSLLLAARYDDGSPMSDRAIRDQLVTLVGAGHETTASTLVWALYFLHRTPAALARLRDELAPLGRTPDPEELAKLPYLEAVCHESLRHNPVAPGIIRKLQRPMAFQGYELPVGAGVGVMTSLLHYREDLYPDPQAFRPERFLERSYSPFEFIPFGGGARRCIGATFALYEMKIVLGTMLAQKELRLLEEGPVRPVRRNLVMGPDRGVRMALVGERHAAARAA